MIGHRITRQKEGRGEITAPQLSAGLGFNPRFLASFSLILNRKGFQKTACEIRWDLGSMSTSHNMSSGLS